MDYIGPIRPMWELRVESASPGALGVHSWKYLGYPKTKLEGTDAGQGIATSTTCVSFFKKTINLIKFLINKPKAFDVWLKYKIHKIQLEQGQK